MPSTEKTAKNSGKIKNMLGAGVKLKFERIILGVNIEMKNIKSKDMVWIRFLEPPIMENRLFREKENNQIITASKSMKIKMSSVGKEKLRLNGGNNKIRKTNTSSLTKGSMKNFQLKVLPGIIGFFDMSFIKS